MSTSSSVASSWCHLLAYRGSASCRRCGKSTTLGGAAGHCAACPCSASARRIWSATSATNPASNCCCAARSVFCTHNRTTYMTSTNAELLCGSKGATDVRKTTACTLIIYIGHCDSAHRVFVLPIPSKLWPCKVHSTQLAHFNRAAACTMRRGCWSTSSTKWCAEWHSSAGRSSAQRCVRCAPICCSIVSLHPSTVCCTSLPEPVQTRTTLQGCAQLKLHCLLAGAMGLQGVRARGMPPSGASRVQNSAAGVHSVTLTAVPHGLSS